ncbi:hypothetical protein Q0V21_31145 [Paenibacillus sp. 11B]|nr:hypothetical protein [Paenibacillus sp. 11B]MDN8593188.1 hypothetical protein [Paenibacillus sp. 11B]
MNIEAIRHYTKNRKSEECSLTVDEDNDYEALEFSSGIQAKLTLFMLANGLKDKWIMYCPEWFGFPELDELKEQHMNWLDALPDPKLCLRFMTEHQILENAEKHNLELYSHLLEITAFWKEGFKVFVS